MQTGMYAISEMASLFNVSRQTLIYYDKIGLFKPAVVNEKGYRFYSPTQIPLMRLICMLRDLGLELDEIDRLTSTFDIGEMTDHLRSRVQALDEQIAGAGSFAVLPRGAEELLPSDAAELAKIGVEVLPEGTYLCMSRWGMPYEPEGIRAIVACMDEHALQPIGNAFDFCYLDTTSYDESHQEDFCCIQIPVVLK